MKLRINLKSLVKLRLLLLLPVIFFMSKQLWLTWQGYTDCAKNVKSCIVAPWGTDFITTYGTRYTQINQFLTTPTRIGYYGEPGESFGMWANNYVLSQYFMAPHVLEDKKANDTILYNLYGSQNPALISSQFLQQGWHILKDFNNGLILLSKTN